MSGAGLPAIPPAHTAGQEAEGPLRRWVLEAAFTYLREGAAFAGLSRAAVRPIHATLRLTADSDGELVWPSEFCTDSRAWLTALSHVVLRNVPVRLYLIETDPEDAGRMLALTRLYPRFDEGTLAILRGFSGGEAEALSAAAARVEEAFARLRADPPPIEGLWAAPD
ncbi:MAG: hypothetical protein OHK0024_37000 [Thalassobaculales bacterium]